jgi:hypothetical protein
MAVPPWRLHARDWDTDVVDPECGPRNGRNPAWATVPGMKGVRPVGSVRVARATGGGDPPRWPGFALRTATAIALAAWMIALASPSGGADPHGDPGRHTALAVVEGGTTPAPTTTPATAQNDATPFADATASPASGTTGDVKRARAEAETAGAALLEARLALDRALAAEAEALSVEVAAQEGMLASRVRLGDLIAVEDAALVARTRAAARVESAPAGSKRHRSAFTEWQMAAVAERAAHARRTIAEDESARLFVALQVVEDRLAETEIALTDARAAHRKAERTASAASNRVAESEAATSAGPSHAVPLPSSPRTPVSPGNAVGVQP